MLQRCSECGETHDICPECESRNFTRNEPFGTPNFDDFTSEAEEGDTLESKDICWECGFVREYRVTVEEIHET